MIVFRGQALALAVGILGLATECAFGSAADSDSLMRVEMLAGGNRAEVTCEVIRLTPRERLAGGQWWGGDGGPPSTAIRELRVQFDGDAVEVPRSAFADLGEPPRLEAKYKRGALEVRILGGDAASSYECRILVRKARVVSRIVRAGEFPEQAWERTRYTANSAKN